MSSFKFYLPCRNSVRPFGIQCVSEFSAQIFLTVVGIQCLSEFSAQSEFSAGTYKNRPFQAGGTTTSKEMQIVQGRAFGDDGISPEVVSIISSSVLSRDSE